MKKKSTINIHAKKSLGQNFLVNQGVLDKIIAAGEVTGKDTVIEIGPGTGNLTKKLVATGAHIVAIEKDHRLIEQLRRTFPDARIVEADILEVDAQLLNVAPKKYKVIANIPYYITSHLIRLLCEEWPIPTMAILMVQKEVAQRMMATSPDMNLLALSTQYYMTPSIIMYVSPGSFSPAPDVDSALIKLTPRAYDSKDTLAFFKTIKAAFAQKRKKTVSNLSTGLNIPKEKILNACNDLGLLPTVRSEEISFDQWLKLSRMLY